MHGHVALMPDAHLGKGATVGSVIPTRGAIIPSAVGVDIGCGVVAAETTLTAGDLPDDLTALLRGIERRVPAGVGKGHEHGTAGDRWMRAHPTGPATTLDAKLAKRALDQFGTLGSGNHFLEVCVDERDRVWLLLHSGSRGVGNVLAQKHIAAGPGTRVHAGGPPGGPRARVADRGHTGVRRVRPRHAVGAGLRARLAGAAWRRSRWACSRTPPAAPGRR